MNKLIATLLGSILCLSNLYSQINFEPGYIVTKSGDTLRCLIKNVDWKNNPNSISYRLSETAPTFSMSKDTIQEFAIGESLRYTYFVVDIDTTVANRIEQLSFKRNPEFKTEGVLLKELIKGSANLYSYDDGITYFYFTTDEKPTNATALVYKKYKKSYNLVATNNHFRQQLYREMKCEQIAKSYYENIKYTRSSLSKFFKKYNQCIDPDYKLNKDNHSKKLKLNLSPRIGLTMVSVDIMNSVTTARNTSFGPSFNYRLSTELELILPFNKNKWAVLLEPSYENYKATAESESSGMAELEYAAFTIPFGLRHYFYINDKSSIFLNASMGFDLMTKGEVTFENGKPLELSTAILYAFGVGYNLNHKVSLELRHNFNHNILYNYVSWSSSCTKTSLILGYNLF